MAYKLVNLFAFLVLISITIVEGGSVSFLARAAMLAALLTATLWRQWAARHNHKVKANRTAPGGARWLRKLIRWTCALLLG